MVLFALSLNVKEKSVNLIESVHISMWRKAQIAWRVGELQGGDRDREKVKTESDQK